MKIITSVPNNVIVMNITMNLLKAVTNALVHVLHVTMPINVLHVLLEKYFSEICATNHVQMDTIWIVKLMLAKVVIWHVVNVLTLHQSV